ILAWLGVDDNLAGFVVQAYVSTVDFSFRRPQLKFSHVLEDHAYVAQLVVDHFLSRGFTHYIFYSNTGNWIYQERGTAFVAALKAAGHECVWLRWKRPPTDHAGRTEWTSLRNWLAARLKEAPKPVAVFAANDQHALEVLDVCELTNL